MPKLSMGGKVKHYAYTPEGKAQYERDRAMMKMSPGIRPQDAGSGTGGGTYTPPKPTKKYSSRITYANTPKPSTTKPKRKRTPVMPTSREFMERRGKRKSSDSGIGTDGLEGFKSAGQRIAERLKTKSQTRIKR
jgi:hypothetical protein